jgi:hypothetical protein
MLFSGEHDVSSQGLIIGEVAAHALAFLVGTLRGCLAKVESAANAPRKKNEKTGFFAYQPMRLSLTGSSIAT